MIGLSDVTRLEEDTRALRESDYRSGGESCLDGVRHRIRESVPLLAVPVPEQVRRRLHVAVADLRNLAGWVCFDAGLVSSAHNDFSHALVLAGLARDDRLTANVCSGESAMLQVERMLHCGQKVLADRVASV